MLWAKLIDVSVLFGCSLRNYSLPCKVLSWALGRSLGIIFLRVDFFTLAAGCKVLSFIINAFISHLPQYALHVTDKLVDIPDIENNLIV